MIHSLGNVLSGPSEPGGLGGLELMAGGARDNFQTVLYFLYNSVLNEKECNGQPPPPKMKFVPTALSICILC